MIGQQLRVCSLNCRGNPGVTKSCYDYIEAGRADIFLIQEANERFSDSMKDLKVIDSRINTDKGYPGTLAVKQGRIVILAGRLFKFIVEIQSSNIRSAAAIFETATGFRVGIVSVHLRRDDQESTVHLTTDYPRLLDCLALLKYGGFDDGAHIPKVNVIIHGGDFNLINEELVSKSFMQIARPNLGHPYYVKSRLVGFVARLLNIGTNTPRSENHWTFGLRLFDESYYTIGNHSVSIKVDRLTEHFKQFLDWRRSQGIRSDLSLVPLSVRERNELINTYGFRKATGYPCFKFLYNFFVSRGETFEGLTVGHFFSVHQPGWVDSIMYSNNVTVRSYTYPRFVLAPWPLKTDHRMIESIITILREFSDPFPDHPAGREYATEIANLMSMASAHRIRRFAELFSESQKMLDLYPSIPVRMG